MDKETEVQEFDFPEQYKEFWEGILEAKTEHDRLFKNFKFMVATLAELWIKGFEIKTSKSSKHAGAVLKYPECYLETDGSFSIAVLFRPSNVFVATYRNFSFEGINTTEEKAYAVIERSLLKAKDQQEGVVRDRE